MPRPVKCSRVCDYPISQDFIPQGELVGHEPVNMTVDEYETIRLMDLEGLSQEQCAELMEVGRTTVQKVYENARKKLALMLTQSRPLHIGGGEYRLCDGRGCGHGYDDCYKKRLRERYSAEKGEDIMRIAVTYEDGQVFQHFGHTGQFKIYDVQDGHIVSSEVVDTNGTGHGALAGMLQAMGVDTLICGGIGGGARAALAAAGIRLYGGVSGSADEAAAALCAGSLSFDPEAECHHHDHEDGHDCGHHGEGHCGHHDHECGGHGHGEGHGCGGHHYGQ